MIALIVCTALGCFSGLGSNADRAPAADDVAPYVVIHYPRKNRIRTPTWGPRK